MFCFCTNQIKTLRLSVRTIYPSVLTKSQKGSSFCPYNFSFCTSQIANWFGFLFVKVLLLYQPNHKKVFFLSVQLFLLYHPNYKLVRLSVRKVLLLYQPNHKMLRFSVRIIYLSVLANSQKGSSFCPYNFSFCTSQITN